MKTSEWADWSCAVHVTVARPGDLAPATETVRGVMDEVAASVSRFRDDSDLARINRAAGRMVPVSALTVTLVELGLKVAELTADAVTPTVGAALLRLGYDEDIDLVRSRRKPTAAIPAPAPASTTVRVDRRFARVGVCAGTMLDFGASAKAYAVDEAVRRIAREADGPVLVSIGGDLAVTGAPSDGWTVAVSETAEATSELVTLHGGALTTSSTQGRRWAGGRHHIIDPRTGLPARERVRAATVWAPTAVEANLLSTWTLVDPAAAESALAGYSARLVTTRGDVERLHGWPWPSSRLGVAS